MLYVEDIVLKKTNDWLTRVGQDNFDHSDFVKNHIWITGNQIKIPVRAMSTAHINNCIACFKENRVIPSNYLGGKRKWLRIFNNELTRRQ